MRFRAVPIAILLRFGLIKQALPLSNFYIKIVLPEGVDDDMVISNLTYFNRLLKDNLFHSFFNGDSTTSLAPPAPKPPPSQKFFLILECPPPNISEEDVARWLGHTGEATDVSVHWAESPNGTALVAECDIPTAVPPTFITINHKQ